MMRNSYVLAEKINFSILKLRFQIYIILSSSLSTHLFNFRAAILNLNLNLNQKINNEPEIN